MRPQIIRLFFMNFHHRMLNELFFNIFLSIIFVSLLLWFSSRQLEEAKRLTRRMGDCFSFETIDMTITHVILPDDDPQMTLTLDLLLALIYGW